MGDGRNRAALGGGAGAMRMSRPAPGRRTSAIAIALLAAGVCAVLGALLGAPQPGPSNAASSSPFASAATPQFEASSDLAAAAAGSSGADSNASAGVAAAGTIRDPSAAGPSGASPLAAQPTAAGPSAQPLAETPGAEPATAGAAASTESEGSGRRIREGVLERGDSLLGSLTAQGVSPQVVHRIAREMAGHYDFRHAQPGHRYRLVQAADGEIEAFHYQISPIIGYDLSRTADGGYAVVRDEAELWPRPAIIAGIVTSSLYGAITDLGGAPQLASDFTDVFAYDVDFSRMIRTGDEFRILYERLFRTGEDGEEIFVRPGRILAARYAGAAGEYTALYFESEAGRGGYYRPDGSTVQREFMMAPVRYARVTSRYSAARRHPILKIMRPHHGIDYAAASGTPVFAVAGGEVIYSGRAGGFGNLVKIRHRDGYVTYYAHLSRFADGLHVGQPVSQKQVIGYVGSTGLSTGPHVCFRVAKNGKYVNPIQLPAPQGPPLPEQFADEFQARRDILLASLDSGTLVAADEAL